MIQLNEVVASMHVWMLFRGENDPTHCLVIARSTLLQAVTDIPHVPMYRIDIPEIPMKECSAYGEVGCDGGNDCDQREEPHVYEIPHAQ